MEDKKKPLMDLEHGRLSDPMAEAIRLILREQEKLGKRLRRLENLSGIATPKAGLEGTCREIAKEFGQGEGI